MTSLLVAMGALAGCTANVAEAPSQMSNEFHLNLTGCTGASTVAYLPESMNDPTVPASHQYEWPINGFYYFFFQCERFSTGPYERPLNFILEAHSNNNPPEECLAGDFGIPAVLVRLWLPDEEIATYLRDEVEMPTRIAVIDITKGPISEQWSWTSEGATSTVAIPRSNVVAGSIPEETRFFWYPKQGLHFMDFLIDGPYEEGVPVLGQLATDASYGKGVFPGIGSAYGNLLIAAEIESFGDVECTQPRIR